MTQSYLAGSCGIERRTEMKRIAEELRKDYKVYCPFELKIENAWDMPQEVWAQRVFECDKMAIDACDCMVVISPGRESTAGTNWEQGYAYARGKKVFVFQYTDEPTSLMTYCGCGNFYNASRAAENGDLPDLIRMCIKEDWLSSKRGTRTVLT